MQVRSKFLKILLDQACCARAADQEFLIRKYQHEILPVTLLFSFAWNGSKFAASMWIENKKGSFELKTKAGYEMDAEIKEKAAKKVTRIEY